MDELETIRAITAARAVAAEAAEAVVPNQEAAGQNKGSHLVDAAEEGEVSAVAG